MFFVRFEMDSVSLPKVSGQAEYCFLLGYPENSAVTYMLWLGVNTYRAHTGVQKVDALKCSNIHSIPYPFITTWKTDKNSQKREEQLIRCLLSGVV